MTASNRPSTSALLVQLTDTHLSETRGTRLRGIDPQRTLEAVIELATPWLRRADHIVLTGDLTHDGQAQGAHRLRDLIAPFGKAVSHLPGNHDDPMTLAQALGGQPDEWPRLVRIQGWDLILLNSRLPGCDGGQVGEEQRKRLAEWLQEASERPVLVALHHQPVAVGSPWMDEMAATDGEQLMALLRQHHRARGVLFGHVHQQFDTQMAQLRLMGSPATCMQFEPHSTTSHSDQRLPGFRWLQLGSDGSIDSGVERLSDWPDGVAPIR